MDAGEEVESRESLAYHEAGHVVAAHLLDIDFGGASLVAEEDSAGRVKKPPSPLGFMVYGKHKDKQDERLKSRVTACLSGLAARKILTGEEALNPGATWGHQDMLDAFDMAAYLTEGQQEETSELLEQSTSRAERLLREHWSGVEAVAAALLEHEELDREKALAVFEESQGWKGDGDV